MTSSLFTRAALGAVGVLAASAALAAPAHAALVATTTDCGSAPEVTQPFTPWGDANSYKLVGAFEDGGAGWTLSGGAGVVAGNEPFNVHGAADVSSLALPAGSTAVSPPVCVGHDEPTLRFVAHGFTPLSVGVQVTLVTGTVLTLPIGVDTGSAWAPSVPLNILANSLPPAGQYTAVRFTFTPLLGDWQLDDVYVDPRSEVLSAYLASG